MTRQRRQTPRALRQLDHIARALAKTTNLKEVKAIRDQAEALRHYAHAASLGLKAQNRAAEVKLRAERRAGELLSQVVNHGGDRKGVSKNDVTRLKELGIDHNQSARWQREAAVPEPIFEKYVSESGRNGKEITAQGLLRLERSILGVSSRRRTGTPTTLDEETEASRSRPGQSESLIELLAELQDHRILLEQILSPIWNDNGGADPAGRAKTCFAPVARNGGITAASEQALRERTCAGQCRQVQVLLHTR